jgi:N6-L-threonylcarbamoyladenine synthase
LVGVCYAKSLAFARDIPLVGVNHIEGHVYSVAFDNPPVEFPAMALIVSGGHTNLFWIPEEGQYKVVSRTRDDAAGEAFDKVAKMLGLGYPGGPVIEQIASTGDPNSVKFTRAKISDGRPDFSFSGLKTAVARHIREAEMIPARDGQNISKSIADLAASFQKAVITSLVGTMEKQAVELRPRTLIVAGGVACNRSLREEATRAADRLAVPVYFPSRHLSTDNAAMIAAAGARRLELGESTGSNLSADITMRLQNLENEDAALRKSRVRYKL